MNRLTLTFLLFFIFAASTLSTANSAFRGSLSNSKHVSILTSNTTSIVFPETRVESSDPSSSIDFVYFYNFTSSFLKSDFDANGTVTFYFIAFGKDISDPDRKLAISSNATLSIGSVAAQSKPGVNFNRKLQVNSSEVEVFMYNYYSQYMWPTILQYFNITPTTTISIPDSYLKTKVDISCSKNTSYYYCLNADSKSSLSFVGAPVTEMGFTVDARNNGNFSGKIQVDYNVSLVNFTSPNDKHKKSITEKYQGTLTFRFVGKIDSDSDGAHNIQLALAAEPFASNDRHYFVSLAAEQLFDDHLHTPLQALLKGIMHRF